jgi:hypothetical protein
MQGKVENERQATLEVYLCKGEVLELLTRGTEKGEVRRHVETVCGRAVRRVPSGERGNGRHNTDASEGVSSFHEEEDHLLTTERF